MWYVFPAFVGGGYVVLLVGGGSTPYGEYGQKPVAGPFGTKAEGTAWINGQSGGPGPKKPGSQRRVPAWPFPTRSKSQYRRVDQGWDLQYAGTTPVPVLAVEDGVLQNAGPDPGGFGPGYPLLMLDTPVEGYPAVYYGHTFTDQALIGQHVSRGQVIGLTGGAHSGGNAYGDSNWLEIGFWNNGPAAHGASGSTGPGEAMQKWLSGAAAGSGQGGTGQGGNGGLLGGLLGLPGDVLQAFDDLDKLVNAAMWLFQPSNWVRIVAGIFGAVFLIAGIAALTRAA